MTDQTGPVPQRIGDRERDQAVSVLRDNLAEGRLDQAEFDERLTQALSARVQTDLDPLFVDLPAGPDQTRFPHQSVEPAAFQPPPWQAAAQPSQQVAPQQPSEAAARNHHLWAVLGAIAWPLALIACFATDWRYWWIILLPLLIPWWHNKDRQDKHRNRNR